MLLWKRVFMDTSTNIQTRSSRARKKEKKKWNRMDDDDDDDDAVPLKVFNTNVLWFIHFPLFTYWKAMEMMQCYRSFSYNMKLFVSHHSYRNKMIFCPFCQWFGECVFFMCKATTTHLPMMRKTTATTASPLQLVKYHRI